MTTDLVLSTDSRTVLAKEAELWAEMAKRVESFVVTTDEEAAYATNAAKEIRALWRAKEEERTSVSRPLLAAKAAHDALFKPSLDAMAAIKRHFEQAFAAYDLAREQARARVLAESAAQIAQAIVPTAPIPEPVYVEKTSVRHVWEPEVVDPELVPREYCSPDLGKLKAAIWYADTAHKEPQPIPGVRFALKSVVVVR